jgi:hypothetical protein
VDTIGTINVHDFERFTAHVAVVNLATTAG